MHGAMRRLLAPHRRPACSPPAASRRPPARAPRRSRAGTPPSSARRCAQGVMAPLSDGGFHGDRPLSGAQLRAALARARRAARRAPRSPRRPPRRQRHGLRRPARRRSSALADVARGGAGAGRPRRSGAAAPLRDRGRRPAARAADEPPVVRGGPSSCTRRPSPAPRRRGRWLRRPRFDGSQQDSPARRWPASSCRATRAAGARRCASRSPASGCRTCGAARPTARRGVGRPGRTAATTARAWPGACSSSPACPAGRAARTHRRPAGRRGPARRRACASPRCAAGTCCSSGRGASGSGDRAADHPRGHRADAGLDDPRLGAGRVRLAPVRALAPRGVQLGPAAARLLAAPDAPSRPLPAGPSPSPSPPPGPRRRPPVLVSASRGGWPSGPSSEVSRPNSRPTFQSAAARACAPCPASSPGGRCAPAPRGQPRHLIPRVWRDGLAAAHVDERRPCA